MASDTNTFGAQLDREIIRFEGPQDEQHDFLQSLVTNDVASASPKTLVYAALLTPQGKYLSDFFVGRTSEDDFWLDVSPAQGAALEKRLAMYKLRRPLSMVRTPEPVSAIWGAVAPANGVIDPRNTALGWRVYIAPDTALRNVQTGDYTAHRLRLCVPESEIDLISNDTYILEAGFENLKGVDFRKGCYVGQEIVARMKHKTELRKRYALVSLSSPVPAGTPIQTEENKTAGTIFSNQGGIGIALLRMDRVHSTQLLTANDSIIKLN